MEVIYLMFAMAVLPILRVIFNLFQIGECWINLIAFQCYIIVSNKRLKCDRGEMEFFIKHKIKSGRPMINVLIPSELKGKEITINRCNNCDYADIYIK